ncbi:MAG: hypothetical protein Q9M19_02720 [Mariprofundaceae bacterium]|nr:hypothetical protein [Mariprofundaceae bacterium]
MARASQCVDASIMKTLMLLLSTVIVILGALLLFPNAAGQPVRIEILGWLFETRTGMFALLLCLLGLVYWLLHKLIFVSIHGPKQLWDNLRSGNSKRRETRLQEAVAIWVDEGSGCSAKQLKRSKGMIPSWLHASLGLWMSKPSSFKVDEQHDNPLHTALQARLATDAEHIELLSLSERQHYLDVWLGVHPAAPLALQRKAVLLGDLGEHTEQVALFEQLWVKHKDVSHIKADYAKALCQAAQQDPDQALTFLRKAQRLNGDNAQVCKALAIALAKAGDTKSAQRLLLDYLSQHDALDVAEVALKLGEKEALQWFKQVDKPVYLKTLAGSWLRVCLAHQAELSGLAEDGLQRLLDAQASPLLWQTRAAWYAEEQAWEKAVHCYAQAELCRA